MPNMAIRQCTDGDIEAVAQLCARGEDLQFEGICKGLL